MEDVRLNQRVSCRLLCQFQCVESSPDYFLYTTILHKNVLLLTWMIPVGRRKAQDTWEGWCLPQLPPWRGAGLSVQGTSSLGLSAYLDWCTYNPVPPKRQKPDASAAVVQYWHVSSLSSLKKLFKQLRNCWMSGMFHQSSTEKWKVVDFKSVQTQGI